MDNNQNNGFNNAQEPNQDSNQNPNQGWQQPQYQQPPYQAPQYPQPPLVETEPVMSVGQWILTLIVMMIPCVNIIMLFVWGFSSEPGKKGRSNFCKAQLIMMAIGIVLEVLLLILFGTVFASIISEIATEFGSESVLNAILFR